MYNLELYSILHFYFDNIQKLQPKMLMARINVLNPFHHNCKQAPQNLQNLGLTSMLVVLHLRRI